VSASQGRLEQLAVMPLKPRDVFLGKIVPYFAVATLDLAIVVGVGVTLFGVPFRGSVAVFALGALLFLFVTLGLGILISSVSENQGQAIQLSLMVTLPQVLLSGLIFPLSSIAAGVRWISYLLPLTYFNEISRGGDAPRRTAHLALAAVPLPGAARRDCVHPGQPAVPGLPRTGRAARRRREPIQRREPGQRNERGWRPGLRERRVTAPGAAHSAGDWWGTEDVCVRYGSTVALDHVWFRAGPGQVSVVVGGDGAGPHHPAPLPGRRARPGQRPGSGGLPRWRPGTCRPAPVPTRTCRSRRTWRSAPPPTGSRRRRPGSAARNSWPGPGWTRSPEGLPGNCPAACGRSSA